MAAKSIRKSVAFDDSDGDRILLDAIATHQSEQQQTFSDLCKQALRQYLLNQEPTQSVMLFMELQHQIAQIKVRVAALEDNSITAAAFREQTPEEAGSEAAEPSLSVVEVEEQEASEPVTDDPVLSRLGPLLDDF
ncbi:MAG: hypothetical protein AAF959_13935 [Cyanobacteria bacterium P01_D01_bin.56]